jgi:hypothetical protein
MGNPSAPQSPQVVGLSPWPCQWWWVHFLAKCFLAVVTAPYRRTFKLYTWKPLRDFRRTDGDPRSIIPLVRDWKTDKYAELQSVQVAVSSGICSWLLLFFSGTERLFGEYSSPSCEVHNNIITS